jgi:quercetin dioxygenase-like cupin family protein
MSKINFGGMKLSKENVINRDERPDVVVYEWNDTEGHHIVVGEDNAKEAKAPKDATRIVAKHAMLKEVAWMMEINLAKGTETPVHCHDCDSFQYVVHGCLWSMVGDEIKEVRAGGTVFQPKGMMHQNKALEDTRFLEIKVPPPTSE